jgi:ubiquinone/menaquinone biosynthesis C-methylase UbiE
MLYSISQVALFEETNMTSISKHPHDPYHDPFSKENLRQGYNKFAPEYRKISWVNDYILGVKSIRRNLMKQASGHILDVACGTGENFEFFAANSQITAIDLSDGMIDMARAYANELGLDVDFHVMDAENLEFPDNSFDVVTSALSTCTFPDPIKALQEISRVAKPECRILLLEHGRSSVGFVGRWQDNKAHAHYAEVGCRWNQEPIDLLQEAGLPIVTMYRKFFGVFYAIEARPLPE